MHRPTDEAQAKRNYDYQFMNQTASAMGKSVGAKGVAVKHSHKIMKLLSHLNYYLLGSVCD